MDNTLKSDGNIEAKRDQIEEKHRLEILNLLKSFEFERKDIELRVRKEFENKENGRVENLQTSDYNKVLSSSNEEKHDFDKEKKQLLLKIAELEERIREETREDSHLVASSAGTSFKS